MQNQSLEVRLRAGGRAPPCQQRLRHPHPAPMFHLCFGFLLALQTFHNVVFATTSSGDHGDVVPQTAANARGSVLFKELAKQDKRSETEQGLEDYAAKFHMFMLNEKGSSWRDESPDALQWQNSALRQLAILAMQDDQVGYRTSTGESFLMAQAGSGPASASCSSCPGSNKAPQEQVNALQLSWNAGQMELLLRHLALSVRPYNALQHSLMGSLARNLLRESTYLGGNNPLRINIGSQGGAPEKPEVAPAAYVRAVLVPGVLAEDALVSVKDEERGARGKTEPPADEDEKWYRTLEDLFAVKTDGFDERVEAVIKGNKELARKLQTSRAERVKFLQERRKGKQGVPQEANMKISTRILHIHFDLLQEKFRLS